MGVRCFLIEPTKSLRVYLRRYSLGSSCPGRMSYHNISVPFEDYDDNGAPLVIRDAEKPLDLSIWPKACACGYEFTDQDEAQLFPERIYKRTDTGEEFSLRDAAPGAMWSCEWALVEGSNAFRGPDGQSLCVRLPNGNDWMIDGPASNCTMKDDAQHKCWVRHGIPPLITVGKDGHTCSAGAGSIQSGSYHGFLRNGEFTD